MIRVVRPTFIRQKLFEKNYSLKRNVEKYRYSVISEMKIEFIACLSSLTFKKYLQHPKQMIEWSFIKKMKSNRKLLNADMNINNRLKIETRRRILWLPEEDDEEQYYFFFIIFSSIYSNTITFIFPIQRMNPSCWLFVYQILSLSINWFNLPSTACILCFI